MIEPGLSQPEEANVQQAQELITKFTRVPEQLQTPFPKVNRWTYFLFDSVLYRLYNRVTCTPLVHSDEPLYRITVSVPGRTYEAVITPLAAYIAARLLMFLEQAGVRKAISAGDAEKESTALYVPLWARAKLLACFQAIVEQHKELVKWQDDAIKSALVPRNTEVEAPTLH